MHGLICTASDVIFNHTVRILFQLLLLNENINVTYEYSVNDGQEVVDHMITYSWKVGEYGACNRRCNGGEGPGTYPTHSLSHSVQFPACSKPAS
jgi:hypothetical protein